MRVDSKHVAAGRAIFLTFQLALQSNLHQKWYKLNRIYMVPDTSNKTIVGNHIKPSELVAALGFITVGEDEFYDSAVIVLQDPFGAEEAHVARITDKCQLLSSGD